MPQLLDGLAIEQAVKYFFSSDLTPLHLPLKSYHGLIGAEECAFHLSLAPKCKGDTVQKLLPNLSMFKDFSPLDSLGKTAEHTRQHGPSPPAAS